MKKYERHTLKRSLLMAVCSLFLLLGMTTLVQAGNDDCFNIYISGIDSRSGMTDSSLSDVNIVATINTNTKQILLVSTPRDYYVPLSISNGVCDKLTHAGTYGVEVSRDTLAMLYDIDIDYYFRIDFSGFKEVIDGLGGITIVSDYTFDSQNVKGYHFDEGENFVDGEAALAFVRERYSFSEGDRQRGRNQMAVIKGVVNKMAESNVLENVYTVIKEISDDYKTDIPVTKMISLAAKYLKDADAWNVVSYSVDGTGDSRSGYSMSTPAYVMIPDMTTVEKAQDLMEKVRSGEILTEDDL